MAAESKLQAKVIRDLKKKGWIPFRIKSTGWPDRAYIRSGEIFWIEFKAPGKTPKPHQKLIHNLIKHNMFVVYVVDSWESYLKLGL